MRAERQTGALKSDHLALPFGELDRLPLGVRSVDPANQLGVHRAAGGANRGLDLGNVIEGDDLPRQLKRNKRHIHRLIHADIDQHRVSFRG